jgi:protein-disulfide isomerase
VHPRLDRTERREEIIVKSGKGFAAVAVGLAVLAFVAFAWLARTRAPQHGAPSQNASASNAELLVRPHSPSKGPETAPVTVVEFLDPECEACRAMHPIVRKLAADYGDRVRWVVRYVPLHANSLLASSSIEEARELGKHEQALDLLFEGQPTWGDHQDPRPDRIATILGSLGVPAEKLQPDTVISKHRWKVDQDKADAVALGIRGTPSFFVNGVQVTQLGYAPLKQAIDAALARRAG